MKTVKKIFGLVGYPLTHSFSQKYFTDKFRELDLAGYSYQLFQMDHIRHFPDLLLRSGSLCGLNVTIPYKVDIMNFLDQIDKEAMEVGAVNTIKIRQTKGDIIVKGFNTDIYGFEHSLSPLIKPEMKKALVFGTGGAAKAVTYVLRKLEIEYIQVGRTADEGITLYEQLTKEDCTSALLWVNATSVGMFPHMEECLPLDFSTLSTSHLVYDLIYNPEESLLLKNAAQNGAQIKNGLEMLHLQAERSFEIWENPSIR